MNDEKIRDAFLHLTESADGERVEENVRRKLAERETPERHHRRFPKVALAAACVLLVLAVSAGAYAVYQNLHIYVKDDGHGPYTVMFHFRGEETEMAELSDEVLAEIMEKCKKKDGESNEDFYARRIKFAAWEEAAEWLACGMLTSDLLGEPVQNTVWGADVLISASIHEGEIYSVNIWGTNRLPDKGALGLCYTEVTIPVAEELRQLVMTGRFGKSADLIGVPEGETEVISYHAENGLSTEIAVTYMDRPDNRFAYTANAFVLHKGIMYDFSLADDDRDTALQYMKDIIDSLK